MAPRGKRSAQEFQKWAESIGFTYETDAPSWREFITHLLGPVSEQLPVATGQSRETQLVFARVPGQGRKGTGEQYLAAMTMPFVLPVFTVRPRPPGKPTAYDPFELRTGIPAIDEAYQVNAPDPIAASEALRPPATDHLLQQPQSPVPIAAQGHWLATWQPGPFDPSLMAPMVDLLSGMGQVFSRMITPST
jgi:hypothetical protein